MNYIGQITQEQFKTIFLEMNPGYFERDYGRAVEVDEPASEMLLRLQDFDENSYAKDFDKEVTFGYYKGDINSLKEDVASVVPHWTQFFNDDSRVYCGFINGRVASFCLIEDFGVYEINGVAIRIGGPGCVGTLPEFRNRGIGLTMVKNVTKIIKDEQYDYSYIHYTYETGWYGKLGYRTIISWNGKGFVQI